MTGRVRASAAIVALAFLAVGCRGAEDSKHPLFEVLVDNPPKGYEKVNAPASGPMNLTAAAGSTISDSGAKEKLLERNGFRNGYSRVWTKDEEYILALVFEFYEEDGAQELLKFELESLGAKRDATFSPVPQVPGGVSFTVPAVTAKQFKAVSCEGVWFAQTVRVFQVIRCGPKPGSKQTTLSMAEKQFSLAVKTKKQAPGL